jgi:hypothetical protein
MRILTKAIAVGTTALICAVPSVATAGAAALSPAAPVFANCGTNNSFQAEPDFNNDKRSDYVIGMPDADGGRGGIEVVLNHAQPIVLLPGAGGIPSVPAGSQFGASAAVALVNGDNCGDLLVGIPDLTVDGVPEAGGVQVLFGTRSGFTAGPVITAGAGGAPGVPEANAHFGTSVSSWYFRSKDGNTLITVGVPGATVMGGANGLTPLPQAGEVVNFAITPSGGVDPVATDNPIQTMAAGPQAGAHYGTVATPQLATAPDASHGSQQDTGYFELRGKGFFGQAAGDRLGVSVASGSPQSDDGDVQSLMVGAPGHTVAGHVAAGAVEQFNWEPDTLTYQVLAKTITQATKHVPGKPTSGAQFGAAISAIGPGPGLVDLAISAPGRTVGSATRAGAVYVRRFADVAGHGNRGGGWYPQGWVTINQDIHGVAGVPRHGAAFGSALAAIGTSNGTGATPTLIVGIPGTHPVGKPATGAVETFPVSKKTVKLSDSALLRRADGPQAGDRFGAVVEGRFRAGG